MYNQKVLHLSLEMSEEEVAERYVQSIFSLISNNTDVASLGSNVYPVRVPEFSIGGNGNFLGISMVTLEREVLSACNEESIKKKIKTLERRGEFVIKSFPSGSLTVAHLQSYLDMMEKVYDYKPDVVLLDYPDIMKMSKRDDKRVEVGEIYVELRGLASERNFALVTASQSNRSSMQASIVRDHHASEDISKIATSDNVITINQTDKEKNWVWQDFM